MEILLIGAFSIGGAVGCLLPLGKNLLINAGLLIINIFNLTNPILVLLLSGYFSAAFIRVMMEDLIKAHSTNKEKTKVEIIEFSVRYMLLFVTGLTVACILFLVFNKSMVAMIIIMALSFQKIFFNVNKYVFIKGHSQGTIRRIIGLVIIAILAGLTINNENSGWAINGYFASILCLTHINPSKKELAIEQNLSILDSLRFGVNFNPSNGISSALYYAILLAQSIIWGSEKDTLGMLLNIAFPSHFDSFRIIWAFLTIVVAYCAMLLAIRKYNNSQNGSLSLNSTIEEKIESITVYILMGINCFLLFSNLGFLIIILIILAKCSVDLLGYYPLTQFSVPMLILVSILS